MRESKRLCRPLMVPAPDNPGGIVKGRHSIMRSRRPGMNKVGLKPKEQASVLDTTVSSYPPLCDTSAPLLPTPHDGKNNCQHVITGTCFCFVNIPPNLLFKPGVRSCVAKTPSAFRGEYRKRGSKHAHFGRLLLLMEEVSS